MRALDVSLNYGWTRKFVECRLRSSQSLVQELEERSQRLRRGVHCRDSPRKECCAARVGRREGGGWWEQATSATLPSVSENLRHYVIVTHNILVTQARNNSYNSLETSSGPVLRTVRVNLSALETRNCGNILITIKIHCRRLLKMSNVERWYPSHQDDISTTLPLRDRPVGVFQEVLPKQQLFQEVASVSY